jgi:hypothetical protein
MPVRAFAWMSSLSSPAGLPLSGRADRSTERGPADSFRFTDGKDALDGIARNLLDAVEGGYLSFGLLSSMASPMRRMPALPKIVSPATHAEQGEPLVTAVAPNRFPHRASAAPAPAWTRPAAKKGRKAQTPDEHVFRGLSAIMIASAFNQGQRVGPCPGELSEQTDFSSARRISLPSTWHTIRRPALRRPPCEIP